MLDQTAAEKVMDRVRKLLALSKSSNPHEAAAAMGEAQRLMTEHDLSEAVLEDRPPKVVEHEVEAAGGSRACLWRASLAHKLGKVLGVSVLYTRGSTRVRSFGRGADVAAHAALYHWLVAQLLPQCERDWYGQQRPDRERTTKQAFTALWMIGAEREVCRRMEEARRSVTRAAPQGETAALVLLDRRREEGAAAVALYFKGIGMRVSTSRRTVRSVPGAADMGTAAGARASITPNSRTLAGR